MSLSKIKYLEEETHKLGFTLFGAEDYVGEQFGDVLTLYSNDVEVFIGSLRDLERWFQGFQFARKMKMKMNERIIKLYEQAQAEVVDSDCADYYERIQLKFAELIVKECADVVETAVDQREPASTYVGKIKEHFGVE